MLLNFLLLLLYFPKARFSPAEFKRCIKRGESVVCMLPPLFPLILTSEIRGPLKNPLWPPFHATAASEGSQEESNKVSVRSHFPSSSSFPSLNLFPVSLQRATPYNTRGLLRPPARRKGRIREKSHFQQRRERKEKEERERASRLPFPRFDKTKGFF